VARGAQARADFPDDGEIRAPADPIMRASTLSLEAEFASRRSPGPGRSKSSPDSTFEAELIEQQQRHQLEMGELTHYLNVRQLQRRIGAERNREQLSRQTVVVGMVLLWLGGAVAVTADAGSIAFVITHLRAISVGNHLLLTSGVLLGSTSSVGGAVALRRRFKQRRSGAVTDLSTEQPAVPALDSAPEPQASEQ
jgi:hypothetical protein